MLVLCDILDQYSSFKGSLMAHLTQYDTKNSDCYYDFYVLKKTVSRMVKGYIEGTIRVTTLQSLTDSEQEKVPNSSE